MTFTIWNVLIEEFQKSGSNFSLTRATEGGRKLAEHAQLTRQGDWKYKPFFQGGLKYVVLQEAGYLPYRHSSRNSKSYRDSVQAIIWWDDQIRKMGAQTVIYEPWGRRDGTHGMKSAKDKFDFEKFSNKTRTGVKHYVDILRNKGHKPLFAPVGSAFELMYHRKHDLWARLYDPDGTHPSELGQYLASCVIYATITTKSPRNLPLPHLVSQYKRYADWEKDVLRPCSISDGDAAKVKEIADIATEEARSATRRSSSPPMRSLGKGTKKNLGKGKPRQQKKGKGRPRLQKDKKKNKAMRRRKLGKFHEREQEPMIERSR